MHVRSPSVRVAASTFVDQPGMLFNFEKPVYDGLSKNHGSFQSGIAIISIAGTEFETWVSIGKGA